MTNCRVIVRKSDVCPHCRSVNTIRIDRSFREECGQRVAYGFCRDCGGRVVIREVLEARAAG
jgi:hypothetical protein